MFELVVKVPGSFEDLAADCIDHEALIRAVINGTPLPKGHGRLGDLDALYKEFEDRCISEGKLVKYADTIIEADKE